MTNDDKNLTRVRYAPSPTGLQHIGGVRTALFNYLCAKSRGGSFILRLEDTDRTRFDEKYVKNLFDTMEWLGLDWDEGGNKGGPYAPYVQSERFELYKKYAEELVSKGEAYYCFCDSERLERIRKIQTENKMAPGYDRNCRHLTAEEVKEKLAKGLPHVIRLKVPMEGVTKFHDRILGDIEWKNEDISPDPVLLKSDGFPTYHLANVVDDHLMHITCVMRAQEWIPSTPLHVQMYRAFGWEPPEFCHLPMVNGSDGKKLSKRHGSTSIDEFREKGYLPKAIINYVALLGCSFIEGKDIYTLEELGAAFKIEHLNKSPAVFDYKKLEWYNGQYIRALSDEELFDTTLPFIKKGLSNLNTNDGATKQKLLALMALIKERLKYLTDAPDLVRFAFVTPTNLTKADLIAKKLDEEKTLAILKSGNDFLEQCFGSGHDVAEAFAKTASESLGVKLGDYMMTLRIALTGGKVSPPLIGSILALGKEEAFSRLGSAIKLFE